MVSRKQSDAIIESPAEVAVYAIKLAQKGIEFGGGHVRVNTLCLHGDHPQAVQNAKLVRDALENSGIEIVPL